jgi:hypothetical protein
MVRVGSLHGCRCTGSMMSVNGSTAMQMPGDTAQRSLTSSRSRWVRSQINALLCAQLAYLVSCTCQVLKLCFTRLLSVGGPF